MARLCDADKMQDFLERHFPAEEWSETQQSILWISRFIEMFAQNNADVVEVVRCKDCERRGNKPACAGRHHDYYCSYGVRKENGKVDNR